MNIDRYNVFLRQVRKEDIEIIRLWRNDPSISKYMEYREYINPEMQARWFDKVEQNKDLYFIVEWKGEKIGVVNLKDFDSSKLTYEGGCFFLESQIHRNAIVPYIAVINLLDYAFEGEKVVSVIAHILDNNIRAIRFNLALGYKQTEIVTDLGNRMYTLSGEDYIKMSIDLKRKLHLE